MERKEFLRCVGVASVGAGVCSLAASVQGLAAEGDKPPAPTHTCDQKVDFAEAWIRRFMGALDENLDESTRMRLMRANGRACARDYVKTLPKPIAPVPFDEWVAKAKQRTDGSVQIEGQTIYYQFVNNYQGLDAPEGACLCPLTEGKPAGLSGTYCLCSVGYVEELFSAQFGRPVRVELADSVLRGGKRCRFKIDLA